MVSRDQQKRAAMNKKLQLLRSITNSHALNKTSIISEASKYLQDLKQKVEQLNQEIATAESSAGQNFLPMIKVEEQENVFMVKVFSERNCQGLLVFILEAFEELGLEVLQARVSSSDGFVLEAISTLRENNEADDCVDAQVIKQVVLQGIHKWNKASEQE